MEYFERNTGTLGALTALLDYGYDVEDRVAQMTQSGIGREFDGETKLSYKARDYDRLLSTFVDGDPLGFGAKAA